MKDIPKYDSKFNPTAQYQSTVSINENRSLNGIKKLIYNQSVIIG